MKYPYLYLFLVTIALSGCQSLCSTNSKDMLLTDVHSRLNPTQVLKVYHPDVVHIVQRAQRKQQAVSIFGGRHAMGGQQFGEGAGRISIPNMNEVYGTMRLIEQDDESFLAWARQDYACLICHLHVEHREEGMERAQQQFQTLIDRALELDDSYFLTYQRWARNDQMLAAYPQFVKFLRSKLKNDPLERFQSEWHRHYKEMFAAEL